MAKKIIKDEQKFRTSKNEPIFALIKDEKDKVRICLGGYCVSHKEFDTFEQAEYYISTKPYEMLINICSVILTKIKDNETTKENPQDK